ncbi:GNAT family N-acetyltransferase [Nocardia sp. NPDC049220]|uniref:GNAT family N-acetyltransferase n=1 Tax=Nocardia sp. NPDC049220 TaxID=3155273 RepID=UPI0033CD542D
MNSESPMTATSPAGGAVIKRAPEIARATAADEDDIVRALLAASRIAYADLPGAETGGVERLIADMASRKPHDYRKLLSDGSSAIFIARVDGDVAGYIQPIYRPDRTGQLVAWHVLPEYQGHKVGSHLMRQGLEFLGDIDIYSITTVGTVAEAMHRHFGFEEVLSVPPDHDWRKTPPPMALAGLTAPQVPLILERAQRRLILEQMRAAADGSAAAGS